MAFNANTFVNTSNVPPLYRLINGAAAASVSGYQAGATSIAQAAATSAATNGSALSTIQQQTAAMVTGVLATGSPEFFAATGMAPSQAAAADISSMRISGGSAKQYFTSSNPNLKVDQKVKNNQAVVISVL